MGQQVIGALKMYWRKVSPFTIEVTPDFIPEIDKEKLDVSHFSEVTNLSPKESYISSVERKAILSKVEDFKQDFRELEEDD